MCAKKASEKIMLTRIIGISYNEKNVNFTNGEKDESIRKTDKVYGICHRLR